MSLWMRKQKSKWQCLYKTRCSIINYYLLINKIFLNMASSACYFLLYKCLIRVIFVRKSVKKSERTKNLKTNNTTKFVQRYSSILYCIVYFLSVKLSELLKTWPCVTKLVRKMESSGVLRVLLTADHMINIINAIA